MKKRTLILLILVGFLVGGCVSGPTPTPQVIREIAENKLWVTSVPEGANVYLLPGPPDDYDTLEQLVQGGNLLGSTPLTAKVKPGELTLAVVISAAQIEREGFEVPSASDPLFGEAFEFDGNRSAYWAYEGTSYKPSLFAKVYSVPKMAKRSAALVSILIPLTKDKLLQAGPYLYPPLDMVAAVPRSYVVNEQGMVSAILDNLAQLGLADTVPSEMVAEMVQVLYRVGKVRLRAPGAELIVQMEGPDTRAFSITLRF